MLKSEWLDTLNRLDRLAGRLAKRAEREEQMRREEPAAPGPNGSPPPAPASRALVEVLKRRARHLPPGVKP
jgi:hypothetical protein